MSVNGLGVVLSSLDSTIGKLNHKIEELNVALDIFEGMKNCDEQKKMSNKIVASTKLTGAGLILVGMVASAIIIDRAKYPINLPLFAAGAGLCGISSFILGTLGWKGLTAIDREDKFGLTNSQLREYFLASTSHEKWDERFETEMMDLVAISLKNFQKKHNFSAAYRLADVLDDLNQKIKETEGYRDVLLKNKFFNETEMGQLLPQDVHNLIGSYTLDIVTSEQGFLSKLYS